MTKNKTWETAASTELFNAILLLDNLTEAKKFLRDLMTESELKELKNRWKLIQMLNAKIPYKQIEAETGVSPRTIARGSFWLKRGFVAYKKMLKSKTRKITTNTNLIDTILLLKNLIEAKNFLRDLLTESEIKEFSNRWQAAQMLSKKIPYTQIEKSTGLSPRTIARINRWRLHGMGGYKAMLKKIKKTQ